jgi:hypothetical protein
LESLSYASTFAPAAWLGLSQLHTLLDVDVSVVSVATIAAALPRLHTLGLAAHLDVDPSAVAGFFETSLPRLRAFRFRGNFPVSLGGPSPVLPLLEELIWESCQVADRFCGAHPVTLCASMWEIHKWAMCTHHTASGCGPLSRVRHLRFYNHSNASTVAAVLRAAPELRTLHGGTICNRLEWRDDPAFEGLFHRNLRSIRFLPPMFGDFTEYDLFLPDEYDVLQARHFPRLQVLAVHASAIER